MEKEKIDLNAPAFGSGSQKIADLSEEKEVIEPEKKEEEVEKEEEAPAISVEKQEKAEGESGEEEPKRVTYSRFKNVWSAKEEAEQKLADSLKEVEEWKLKAQQQTPQATPETPDAELPSWWMKLYGDSEASKEAWKIQDTANHDFQERVTKEARERALEALKAERAEEEKRESDSIKVIDTGLEKLSAFIGRDLSEKEQSSVLDIIDEFTPKSEAGNYLGALLPFEKAWEIHELKESTRKSSKAKSRDAVAAINSSQSQGDPSIKAEADKNFNPQNWEAYKDRL